MRIIQQQTTTLFWILLYAVGLLNKCVLVWSKEFQIEHPSLRQAYLFRIWSEWTSWSACSRTCGGGVRMRTRVCKIRVVGYSSSANTCLGDTTEYEICSRQNCSPHAEEFLDYQCSQRNGQNVGGRKIEEWIPYHYGKNPCELQCLSKDRSLIYSFGKVIDGTKCASSDPTQPALCVNGRCTPVDCAGYIGSDNRLDKCGVCRGNNSTCIKYRNVFWGRPRSKTFDGSKDHHYDYNEIASIPAGVTQILVAENSGTNFLALMDHKGSYHINGNWRIQSPGHFFVHGTDFIYNRTSDGRETLSAAGPTRFRAFIYVLGSGNIPTVHYEYWTSTNNPLRTAVPFQSLNQVKHTDIIQNPLQTVKDAKSFDNHVREDSTTKTKDVPLTKFQGYKSYYHRNEILKSVPSWSIKRHRNYKNSINRELYTQNDISSSTSTENSRSSTRYGHLNLNPNYDQNINYVPRIVSNSPTTTVASAKKEKYEDKTLDFRQFGRPNVTAAFAAPLDLSSKKIRSSSYKELQKEPSLKSHQKKKQKSVTEKRNSSSKRLSANLDSCPPCSKSRHQKKNFCLSEFVLRAVVLTSEKKQQSIRYELEVTQSYKNKVPISSREYIWTTDLCQCPKLHLGKEYIIMGRSGVTGNKRESKLLIDQKSFVRQYKQRRAKSMLRLVRDQNTLCKRFEKD